MNPALFSSATDNWATDRAVLARLADEFGPFDLDVCADADNTAAQAWFTAEQNGLAQTWTARAVWMNPPYGRTIGLWIRKAAESVSAGHCQRVVCLVPARTDTRWWQQVVTPHAALIRFVPGRLRFGGAKTPAPFPSAVVVFDETAQISLTRLAD